MGLSSFEFWHSTPREFYNRLKGFTKERSEVDKLSWHQTRVLAFYSFAPHQGKSRRIKEPADLFKFDWEKGHRQTEGYAEEERKEIEKLAKDVWKIKPDGKSSRADHTTGEKVTPDKLEGIIHGV